MMLWANVGQTLADPSFWFSFRGILATLGGLFAGFATYHSIELAAGGVLRKFVKVGGLRLLARLGPSFAIGVLVFLMLMGGGGGRGFGSGGGVGQGMAPTMKNPEEKLHWIIRVLGDVPLKERMGADADRKIRYFPVRVSKVATSRPVGLELVKKWLGEASGGPGELSIELHPDDPDETTQPVHLLMQSAQELGWKVTLAKVDGEESQSSQPKAKP